MIDIVELIDNGTLTVEYESRTQIKTICPICGSVIVISKTKTNDYDKSLFFCTSRICTNYDIFKSLGIIMPKYDNYNKAEFQSIKEVVDPLPIKHRLNYGIINNYPKLKEELVRLNEQDYIRKIYYPYLIDTGDVIAEIVRIEEYRNDQRLVKKFIPYYRNPITEKMEIGSTHKFPLFNEMYIDESSTLDYLFVEGEKCAVECCNKGYTALSCLGSDWSVDILVSKLKPLFYNIDGLVFIPDLDIAGKNKIKIIKQVCANVGLPLKIIDLSKYLQYDESINDIIDIFESTNECLKTLTIEDIIYEF